MHPIGKEVAETTSESMLTTHNSTPQHDRTGAAISLDQMLTKIKDQFELAVGKEDGSWPSLGFKTAIRLHDVNNITPTFVKGEISSRQGIAYNDCRRLVLRDIFFSC